MKLLNPGPVSLTSRVRSALMAEDTCHREPEFAALTKDVIARLRVLYKDAASAYTPVLMTGSGTAAVEAMVGTLTPSGTSDSHALVVANGVYGERMSAMLTAQKKSFEEIRAASWLDPIDLAAVRNRLEKGGISHVLTVHHETTTGRLNDVATLGALCKQYGAHLLLDAVSSFGGEEIRFAEWNLLACAGTANKCLHGAPGVSFVLVKDGELESHPSHATSVYLDLARYEKEQRRGFSPFTQSVPVMFALAEALRELEDLGGVSARMATYQKRMSRVIAGLRDLDVQLLLESERAYSRILTSYKMPKSTTYEALHDALKNAGFVIYAGQGQWDGQIFRISTMGDLSDGDLDRLLTEIARALHHEVRV